MRQSLAGLDNMRAARRRRVIIAAIRVLGSRAEAEAWMARPAVAFGQVRPGEKLSTDSEMQQLLDHLTRMEFGVYT